LRIPHHQSSPTTNIDWIVRDNPTCPTVVSDKEHAWCGPKELVVCDPDAQVSRVDTHQAIHGTANAATNAPRKENRKKLLKKSSTLETSLLSL
jgi:hypothetical protein